MMYEDDDFLMLSGLQHLCYCERQWALIHLEGTWSENEFTAEGRHLHERAHTDEVEYRGGVKTVRGLPLRSTRLGLSGKADVVEFRDDETGNPVVFPVEYKRGRPKKMHCDEVQLCGQVMCLEEMLGVKIKSGALFYGKTRRRKNVVFDDELRAETEMLAARMRHLFEKKSTPLAEYEEKKCRRCSLFDQCLPNNAGAGQSALKYLELVFAETEGI